MNSTLNITLTSIPSAGSMVILRAKYLVSPGNYAEVSYRMTFVNLRQSQFQSTIGPSLSTATSNYVTALRLDYRNSGGQGNVGVGLALAINGNKLYIDLTNENWIWEGVYGGETFLTSDFDNAVETTPITFDLSHYDNSTSGCDYAVAVVDITGGVPPYSFENRTDGTVITGQYSPIETRLERGKTSFTVIEDSQGEVIRTQHIKAPGKLADISGRVTYIESGATLKVEVGFVSEYLFPLEYSIDGINFDTKNVFTGLVPGSYELTIIDAFGCIYKRGIVIDSTSTTIAVNFSISNINPIRFARSVDGKKNRYNTLSWEQNKDIAYPYTQLFTSNDQPITQFKTNAKYRNIYALGGDGSEIPLNAVKRSDNIGKTLKTTATKFKTEDLKTGIYFGAVEVLDPLTDAVLENKNYRNQIPYGFDAIDRVVYISGLGTISIEEIVYNDTFEAFVLKLDIYYDGADTEVTVEADFNEQDYEVYEFVTDISVMPDNFNVVIEVGLSASDVSFTHLSESIQRTTDSSSLLEMVYWNSSNFGDMNYGTGVVHTLRLPEVMSKLADEQIVEGYNGTLERYNTELEIFDGEEFLFTGISEEMVRKLRLVLAHDNLYINGILYRLGESPELNSRFTTNFCELTALLKTGGDITQTFNEDNIQPGTGEGVDEATYELEQAIAAAKGKALILWKK